MVANETKVVVQREEIEATKKATETQAIADDAQRDLDEALPALVRHLCLFVCFAITTTTITLTITVTTINIIIFQEAALTSLKSLNRNEVVEVIKIVDLLRVYIHHHRHVEK